MVLWSSIITGLVGVAGIAGALGAAWLSGQSATDNLRLRLTVEKEQAQLADRRATYASCLAAVNDMITVADSYRNSRSEKADRRKVAEQELKEARQLLFQRAGELWLIAPRNIRQLAHRMEDALTDFAFEVDKGTSHPTDIEAVFRSRRELTKAMRADLGSLD